MFEHDYLVSEPLFWLFIAATAVLVWGYYWGEKENKRLYLSAFNGLVDVIKPVDQTFTNIGGLIGYHGNFVTRKDSPIEKVEATITFLARQSLLYLPVSILIRKHDRLFVTLYMRQSPKEEGHLIEEKYARYRRARITNEARLNREPVRWGNSNWIVYYESGRMRDQLKKLTASHADPGILRHIAVVPDQKKCFVFMIPKKGQVKTCFEPVYRWIPSLITPKKTA
jgi:hypothetical protein